MIVKKNRALAVSAMLLGVLVAAILAVLKYITLLITGSVSIQLNFADSCLDIFVSLINYCATLLSFEKRERYSYGYDKITAFAACFQVFMLLWFAYDSSTVALARITDQNLSQQEMQPSFVAVFSLAVSSLLTVLLVRYQQNVIDKTGHLVVYADRMHYTTDLLTNFSMLGYFTLVWCFSVPPSLLSAFDSFLAVGLSLYIVLCCLKVVLNTWKILMDKRLPAVREEALVSALSKVKGVAKVRVVRSRFSGVREYFDVELAVQPHLSLKEACGVTKHAHQSVEQMNAECFFSLACSKEH